MDIDDPGVTVWELAKNQGEKALRTTNPQESLPLAFFGTATSW